MDFAEYIRNGGQPYTLGAVREMLFFPSTNALYQFLTHHKFPKRYLGRSRWMTHEDVERACAILGSKERRGGILDRIIQRARV